MRRFSTAIGAPVLAGLALAACAATGAQSPASASAQAGTTAPQAGAAVPASEPVDVRRVMQQRINPAMLGIWDIGNNAMNEQGGIDPALMNDARWAALNEAATRLAAAGQEMAVAEMIRAAHPDDNAVGEGEITMAKVQQSIDADPAGFRKAAADLVTHAEKLAAAAAARDAAAAGPLVAEMDGVCEGCHASYWYPE